MGDAVLLHHQRQSRVYGCMHIQQQATAGHRDKPGYDWLDYDCTQYMVSLISNQGIGGPGRRRGAEGALLGLAPAWLRLVGRGCTAFLRHALGSGVTRVAHDMNSPASQSGTRKVI